MFFFWYSKNRYFKARGNLSGQITPFLLIIMVVLLIAAIATVNLGRISLDKTCSANGADAGSLAAASSWAGALNELAELNYEINLAYNEEYSNYANELYPPSSHYIDLAIIYSGLANVALVAAQLAVLTGPFVCGMIWVAGIIAMIAQAEAAYCIFEAVQNLTAFQVYLLSVKSMTDSLHEGQGQRYCNALDYMQISHANSRKTGLNYAFSNSCIPNKLSFAQGDNFNAWLAENGPYKEGIYPWQDKLNQGHTVSSTLDLPEIENFRIQPTKGTYVHISDLLDKMIERTDALITTLWVMFGLTCAAGAAMLALFIMSLASFFLSKCWLPWCLAALAALCSIAYGVYNGIVSTMAGLILLAEMIILTTGIYYINSLRDMNNEVFGDLIKETLKTNFPLGHTCVDGQPSDGIEDYMIVKIDEVIFPKWTTTCCVEQNHPGTTNGILSTKYSVVKSCSTSEFEGGNVGTFNGDDPSTPYEYDPDPVILYNPSITDAN